MKTIANILASLILLLISTIVQAQTVTTNKSSTTTSVHSDSDDGNSSYSYSVSNNKSNNQNSNVSVSISNSNDSYSFRARFSQAKNKEIKAILSKEMSSKNHTTSKNKDYWESKSNGEEVYKISLSRGKLSMHLDKDIASNSLAKKFEALGLTVRAVIVGEQNQTRRDAERLQREADRLRRDAERMQHEADRIQREAQQQAASNANQYRDDAIRIAEKAKLMANEASKLETEASHKGGVSIIIKNLLKEDKTYLSNTAKSNYNWSWPDIEKDIISMLEKNELITSVSDINFNYDTTGMYVNGTKLSTRQANAMLALFNKYKVFNKYGFSFYKNKDHIVLINERPYIENFINDAVNNGLLSSKNDKVKLNINGGSIYKNGVKLETNQLSTFNTLLVKNHIMPAPGKIFEIIKPGNYKVGYTFNGKSHLGTWQVDN